MLCARHHVITSRSRALIWRLQLSFSAGRVVPSPWCLWGFIHLNSSDIGSLIMFYSETLCELNWIDCAWLESATEEFIHVSLVLEAPWCCIVLASGVFRAQLCEQTHSSRVCVYNKLNLVWCNFQICIPATEQIKPVPRPDKALDPRISRPRSLSSTLAVNFCRLVSSLFATAALSVRAKR